MGLFDKFKKKFENVGSQKKVKHAVPEKKSEKKKSAKTKDGSLTPEEIQAAQAMEGAKTPAAKDEAAKKKPEAKREQGPRDTKSAYKILLKPLITEKASSIGSQGKYVFEVYPQATKAEVRKAVQAAYNVSPLAVNIVRVQGKDIRYGLQRGRTKGRKKAIITLPQGKTIDVYQT